MRRKTQEELNYVRLNINLPKEMKERFIAVAKANDTDSSKLIRQFIKDYLTKNSQTTIDFQ